MFFETKRSKHRPVRVDDAPGRARRSRSVSDKFVARAENAYARRAIGVNAFFRDVLQRAYVVRRQPLAARDERLASTHVTPRGARPLIFDDGSSFDSQRFSRLVHKRTLLLRHNAIAPRRHLGARRHVRAFESLERFARRLRRWSRARRRFLERVEFNFVVSDTTARDGRSGRRRIERVSIHDGRSKRRVRRRRSRVSRENSTDETFVDGDALRARRRARTSQHASRTLENDIHRIFHGDHRAGRRFLALEGRHTQPMKENQPRRWGRRGRERERGEYYKNIQRNAKTTKTTNPTTCQKYPCRRAVSTICANARADSRKLWRARSKSFALSSKSLCCESTSP